MQINTNEEYAKKAEEVDEFFMKAFLQSKWGLNKHIKAEAIRGYDEYGEGGLWKRILKKPYRMKENAREYLDYPSKMEFALYFQKERLKTKLFDAKSQRVEYYTEVGQQSQVKFIAAWFSLSRGTFGLTLKPKLMQVRFRERERENPFNEFLLGDSETEEGEEWEEGYDEYPDN